MILVTLKQVSMVSLFQPVIRHIGIVVRMFVDDLELSDVVGMPLTGVCTGKTRNVAFFDCGVTQRRGKWGLKNRIIGALHR